MGMFGAKRECLLIRGSLGGLYVLGVCTAGPCLSLGRGSEIVRPGGVASDWFLASGCVVRGCNSSVYGSGRGLGLACSVSVGR